MFFFPKATQVSPSELQDVFQETSSNIFQINANGKKTIIYKSVHELNVSADRFVPESYTKTCEISDPGHSVIKIWVQNLVFIDWQLVQQKKS